MQQPERPPKRSVQQVPLRLQDVLDLFSFLVTTTKLLLRRLIRSACARARHPHPWIGQSRVSP